jgi:hypothetical protein
LGIDLAKIMPEEALRATVGKALQAGNPPGGEHIAAAIALARGDMPFDINKYGKLLAGLGAAFFLAGIALMVSAVRIRRAAARSSGPYIIDMTAKSAA